MNAKIFLHTQFIFGDVPKWLKGPDSKSGRSVLPAQEFESLHLRQARSQMSSPHLASWLLLLHIKNTLGQIGRGKGK